MQPEEQQPLSPKQEMNAAATEQSGAAAQYSSMRKQTDIKQVEVAPTVSNITCGLAWDFFGDKKIDLDVTVVALDTYSFEIDAAYYNQTSILNGSIVHSGDDKSGVGDGDDEQIRIDLANLPQRCKSLWFIVNAFSGGSFTDVETARFSLYNGNDHSQILYSYGIGMACNSTALLLGTLYVNDPYADDKKWTFKMIEARGTGKNFVESKYLMVEKLNILYDEGILMERPRDRNQKYDLAKGDIYVIDPEIDQVTVGLGWDASSNGRSIDVDASVIIFNEIDDTRTFEKTDIVYYGNLNYADAVVHSGDNLTGKGEGDDETIRINLEKLEENKEADVLCVVINIFSGQSSFKSVKNCFARLVDDRKKELCRFNLTQQYDTQAMIMCHVEKRKNGCWAMITDGVGCQGNTARDSVREAELIVKGEYKGPSNRAAGSGDQETDALVGAANDAAPSTGDCCCVVL